MGPVQAQGIPSWSAFMSPVRLIILLVAAGAAIAAVFLVRSAQTPAPAAAAIAVEAPKKEVPTKQILVARLAIPVGKFIVADDLKWQDWPEASPTGVFIDKKTDAEGLEKMVGAVARFELVEGEPVTVTKLIHSGDQSFMAAMLTPGMRAASIEISPETAAGGFILPNDHIDVILTREIETNGVQKQSVRSDMILQNVRVLAIDGIYAAPPKEGQAAVLIGTRATLELSQPDTSLLSTAKKSGDVSFSLRSIADIQSPSGATAPGRVYRDGASSGGAAEGVRVYRYGTESVSKAPAG
jgi:pilus assembly protein CpaB